MQTTASDQPSHPAAPADRPRVAVSACLLGMPVRHDGAHRRDHFVAERLKDLLELLPMCPEMEAGLGVPRPTIQLRRIDGALRLVRSDGSADLSEAMQAVAQRRATEFAGIAGMILKKKSPSCGLERVPVANAEGVRQDLSGTGLFTQQFALLQPLIPLEEEGRLNDPVLRENFFERVYALHRWHQLDPGSVSGFIEFHARHKLMLMARGSSYYRELGRLVAGVTRADLAERRHHYIARLMQVLARRTSRARHVNVLQHAMGFFKRQLDSEDKQELLRLFQDYRQYRTPLTAPLALLRHHLRKNPQEYLARQYYLEPYPDSLAIRAQI